MAGNRTQDILTYGAVPDGVTDCTAAIQRAVDAAAAAGGGTVCVPAGKYLIGTVFLKSFVYLLLQPGSVLLGSMRAEDFSHPRLRQTHCTAMLLAEEQTNCGVLGRGTLDLRRQEIGWTKEHGRPCMILFSLCKNVEVSGITLLHTGFFNVYACGCDGCRFTGLTIDSTDCDNGDGVDLSGSRNVLISDCRITTGDDAIGLKTHVPTEPCENVAVTNCVLSSRWAGIRLGPETCGDFRNVTVSNCVFRDCSDGLKLQICDGYVMEDLTFSDLNMRDVKRPLFITRSSYPMSEHSIGSRPMPGPFRRVLVSDLIAHMPHFEHDWFENQLVLFGLPDAPVTDVTLRGIRVVAAGGGKAEEGTEIPELLDHTMEYPDVLRGYPRYPSACLYVRNAERIRITDCVFEASREDLRPAVAAEAVEGLLLRGAEAVGCAGLLRFHAVTGLNVLDCIGACFPAAGALAEKWDEFRSRSLREEAAVAENAAALDECRKRPVLKRFPSPEGGLLTIEPLPAGCRWLELLSAEGSLLAEADGREIFRRERSAPYDWPTAAALPLPEGIARLTVRAGSFGEKGVCLR